MKLTKKSIHTVKDCIEHYSMFKYKFVNMWIENKIWETATMIICNHTWSSVVENLKYTK
jgi:hypothetical protein